MTFGTHHIPVHSKLLRSSIIYLRGKMTARLIPRRIDTRIVSTNSTLLRTLPCTPIARLTRLYHQSSSSQDKAASPAPSSSPRPQQGNKREALVWQSGKRKETRNRISTLALDVNAVTETEESSTKQGSHQDQHSKHNNSGRRPADKILSRSQRRILLLSCILLLPVIGRDIMEVVVPGVLGTIIFVGSKVKSGIKWVRGIGSGEKK